MLAEVMSEVTQIIERISGGEAGAAAQLLPLVYDELRRLAAAEMSRESGDCTLQPTALLHEAYLRLVDSDGHSEWNHSGHFFSAAAQAMRRILVEKARRRQTEKHGGGYVRQPLSGSFAAEPDRPQDVIALDEALSRLEACRPEVAQLVTLRYFGGLTMPQAAESLGMSLRSAERNWTYARAWLLEELASE